MTRWISLIGTGGTIASVTDGAGRLSPHLQAADLLPRGASDLPARVVPRSFLSLPSREIGPSRIFELATAIREEIEAGASAVVVTHGTDTLEETAYGLRMLLPYEVPVVLTGSMRGADSAESDGPGNLRDALAAAAEPALASHGVVVVMHGDIHAARWVRKMHTLSLDAFASPGHGAIGRVVDRHVSLLAPPDPVRHTLPLTRPPDKRVALLWSVGDDDAFAVDRIAAGLDGLVVAALGAGHVSARTAQALKRLAERCPVVLASRCGAGPVLAQTYGGPGSESDLLSAGLLPAGRLDPVKCRLRLVLGLSGGARGADLFPVG